MLTNFKSNLDRFIDKYFSILFLILMIIFIFSSMLWWGSESLKNTLDLKTNSSKMIYKLISMSSLIILTYSVFANVISLRKIKIQNLIPHSYNFNNKTNSYSKDYYSDTDSRTFSYSSGEYVASKDYYSDTSSSSYNPVQDSFDFPNSSSNYNPHENQLYDNFRGGWND